MPISFSPTMRPSSVSHTGLRMRSPMILLLRKYSSLWMTTRNARASSAVRGDTVKAIAVITVLLTRLPTTGTIPQRKVTPRMTARLGSPAVTTKMAVSPVLIAEITTCAPMTVVKLR